MTPGAVLEKVPQAKTDAAESDRLPGNGVFREEYGFEALFAGGEFRYREMAAVEKMDLVDMSHVHHGEGGADNHFRTGFFQGLTRRGFGGGFAVFHEACG